jgi:hypothetical protein
LLLGRRRLDVQEVRWTDVCRSQYRLAEEVWTMTAGHWRHCLAVLTMALTSALGSAGPATAQDEATRTLTILAARCPAGYASDASADECDDAPVHGVTFRVGRPYTDFVITARTDDAGVVMFDIADLPYRGTVRIIEELPPGTARVVAYCVDDAGAPVTVTDEPFPDNDPPIAAALVTVGDAGDIRCDWYNVPAIDDGATPTSEASPTSEPAS